LNQIAIGDGLTAHQGDWEHITIEFGLDGAPTHVTYAGHGCTDKVVEWDNVQTTDRTHPHVYAAEGSHASYPSEISRGQTYCLPEEYPSGEADVAEYDPATSVEWRTWTGTGTKRLEAECWYGFGGAWGEHRYIGTLVQGVLSDHATGPVGPPFNSGIATDQEPLSTSACRPDDGWTGNLKAETEIAAKHEWGSYVALEFEDGAPTTEVVASLNSLPIEVARGTVDAAGELRLAFQIPAGTPPGAHRLIVQDAQSGATFFVAVIWVDTPVE
jgi:hypothetical protein